MFKWVYGGQFSGTNKSPYDAQFGSKSVSLLSLSRSLVRARFMAWIRSGSYGNYFLVRWPSALNEWSPPLPLWGVFIKRLYSTAEYAKDNCDLVQPITTDRMGMSTSLVPFQQTLFGRMSVLLGFRALKDVVGLRTDWKYKSRPIMTEPDCTARENWPSKNPELTDADNRAIRSNFRQECLQPSAYRFKVDQQLESGSGSSPLRERPVIREPPCHY